MALTFLWVFVSRLGFLWAEVDPTSAVFDAILKGGPFALILALFLLDKLDTTSERNLLRLQLLQSQERERKLYESIKNDLAPALSENTYILTGAIKPMLERVAVLIEIVERRLGRER